VERQGCGGQVKLLSNPACGESFGAGFYEKAEDLEPRVLRESGERIDSL